MENKKDSFILLPSEAIVTFDVDETLVHELKENELKENDIFYSDNIRIADPYSTSIILRRPNSKHIKLMRDMKARGKTIIVWSKAGPRWARAVILALNLQDIVTLIMCKPQAYVDDLQCEQFMGERIYLERENV